MFAETVRHVRLSDPITTSFPAKVTTAVAPSDQEMNHLMTTGEEPLCI